MIAIDFSRAKAVCAVRYANFTGDCCKFVVSAPHLGLLGKASGCCPGAMTLGSGKGRQVQIRSLQQVPGTRPWDCRPGARRAPCYRTNALRNWIPGLLDSGLAHAASLPSFPRKREPSGVRRSVETSAKTLGPAFAQMTDRFPDPLHSFDHCLAEAGAGHLLRTGHQSGKIVGYNLVCDRLLKAFDD